MKSSKQLFAFVLLACSGLWLAPGAQSDPIKSRPIKVRPRKAVDISCRPALYFGSGVLGNSPLTSPHVVSGGEVVLTPADAFNEEKGLYSFNVLYAVYGSPAKKAVAAGPFTDRIRIGRRTLSQHEVQFADKDEEASDSKLRFVTTQIKLPLGSNVITLSLDDGNAVKESNEDNNLYSFTVIVTTKP